MPWANDSARRATLPRDWHARRARTKRLAGGRCQHVDDQDQRCTWRSPVARSGQPDGHADHIVPGTDDSQQNLRWLCPPHHAAKSSGEGHDAMRALRAKAYHPRERHPGAR